MKANENGSDPHLKAAMEEVKVVLQKYDCMAAVVLVSPTHSEFLNHFNASWSVLKWEEIYDQQILRVRSKREDWQTKELQKRATEASMHALTTIVEWTRKTNEEFRDVLIKLRKHMTIVWETWE